jgi:hypothetical protein
VNRFVGGDSPCAGPCICSHKPGALQRCAGSRLTRTLMREVHCPAAVRAPPRHPGTAPARRLGSRLMQTATHLTVPRRSDAAACIGCFNGNNVSAVPDLTRLMAQASNLVAGRAASSARRAEGCQRSANTHANTVCCLLPGPVACGAWCGRPSSLGRRAAGQPTSLAGALAPRPQPAAGCRSVGAASHQVVTSTRQRRMVTST